MAFFKAQEAAKPSLPTSGTVLIATAEKNKKLIEIARGSEKLGFKILATEGTHKFLAEHGIVGTHIRKQHEGRPNITDDSYIRKLAIEHEVPCMRTLIAALASVGGIGAERTGHAGVKSLQAYHARIR